MTERWPIEKPVAYAYRTVRNLTVDDWRRSKARPESPDSPCVEESSRGLSPEQLVLSNVGELAVWQAVREFPKTVQDVFVLHYIEEMTIAEVAEYLGLTPRRTYHYRDRIRAKVRALLSDVGETEDPDPNAP